MGRFYVSDANAAKPTVCRIDGTLHCRACSSDLPDPPLPGMFRLQRMHMVNFGPAWLTRPCVGCGAPMQQGEWAGYTPDHRYACERCLFQLRSEAGR